MKRSTRARAALAACLACLTWGCETKDWSKEPVPVTVSAANYLKLAPEDVYARVHETAPALQAPAEVPAAPASPLFYGFVAGDIYPSDVPLETVYRELAVALAHRGYFNVVYEAKAGYLPQHVDYLLRVHYGVRNWKDPRVRTDGIHWGDGMLSTWQSTSSMYRLGEESLDDPRIGTDPAEQLRVAFFLQGKVKADSVQQPKFDPRDMEDSMNRPYCLVVVDAFRFKDVVAKGRKAPCAWSTFMAVPLRTGQEFSHLLRSMAQAATPYFGETPKGLQEFDLPPGKVLLGEPVEVPDVRKSP